MNETIAPSEVTYDLSQMEAWREYEVILYNDEEHSMEEVIGQIIKAIHCSPLRAEQIMLKAHHHGKAVVAIAGKSRAIRIASVLRQIELHVSLRQVN
ncbi:MAG: ATP-dependent Clp protease adaptor ClpS [Candidatus Sumerlaeia bacterium]